MQTLKWVIILTHCSLLNYPRVFYAHFLITALYYDIVRAMAVKYGYLNNGYVPINSLNSLEHTYLKFVTFILDIIGIYRRILRQWIYQLVKILATVNGQTRVVVYKTFLTITLGDFKDFFSKEGKIAEQTK